LTRAWYINTEKRYVETNEKHKRQSQKNSGSRMKWHVFMYTSHVWLYAWLHCIQVCIWFLLD
jgi:hypothetical protein